MQAIATITVPFFAIIFFGYLAARLRWVPKEALPAFNGFLLYFAVPALLFRLVSEMTTVEFSQPRYLVAYATVGIITLLLIVAGALSIFKARLRDAAFYGLAGSVTNVGYLGIPLLVALLGERAAGPAVMSTVIDQAVTAAVALALAQFDISNGRGWIKGTGEAVLHALTNPFLISIAAGAVFSVLGWNLPTPAVEIVRLLGNSAGPCALFAIGVSLVRVDAPLGSAIIVLPVDRQAAASPIDGLADHECIRYQFVLQNRRCPDRSPANGRLGIYLCSTLRSRCVSGFGGHSLYDRIVICDCLRACLVASDQSVAS